MNIEARDEAHHNQVLAIKIIDVAELIVDYLPTILKSGKIGVPIHQGVAAS